MRRVWSVVSLLVSAGCSAPARGPPATARTVAAARSSVATSASPAPGTPRFELPPIRIEHATCGLALYDSDTGVSLMGAGGGAPSGEMIARGVECRTPDGRIAWTLGPMTAETGLALWMRMLRGRIYATEAERDPDRVRVDLETLSYWMSERGEAFATVERLFRDPGRERGNMVRIEARALDIHAQGGATTLSLVLDPAGRDRIAVTLPSRVDERVTDGADVVVFGVADGSRIDHTSAGDRPVPHVLAFLVAPRSDSWAGVPAQTRGSLPARPPSSSPPVRVEHETCGLSMHDEQMLSSFVAPRLPVTSEMMDRGIDCIVPDGSVAWSLPRMRVRTIYAEAVRAFYCGLTARMYATEARRDPRRYRRELARLDHTATQPDSETVHPAALFTDPAGSRNHDVRVDGRVEDLHLEEDVTTFSVVLDTGRRRVSVVFPGPPDERLVSGARVVVYAVATGSHVEHSSGRDDIVPHLMAYHVAPRSRLR